MKHILYTLTLFLVTACSSTKAPDMLLHDQTDLFSETKIRSMLDESTRIVNQARKKHGLDPIEYRGKMVLIKYARPPQSLPERESDIRKAGTTMAGAGYNDGVGVVYLYLQRPNKDIMIHEIAHLVLLSNGIKGHPDWLEAHLKNWVD